MRTYLSALPISGTVAELMIGHKQQGIRAVYGRYQYLEEQRSGFQLWLPGSAASSSLSLRTPSRFGALGNHLSTPDLAERP
jgi:hypothetical protein